MKEEFVTYAQSLALKELGFDEPCFGRYNPDNDLIVSHTETYNTDFRKTLFTQAPTFSQCFRWFREKHDLGHMINGIGHESFIMNIAGVLHIFNAFDFKTYEEAELACLDKLIEIVKKK